MSTTVPVAAVLKDLNTFCDKFPTFKKAAVALKVTQAQLSTTLNGRNNVVPARILKKLGYTAEMAYFRVGDKKTAKPVAEKAAKPAKVEKAIPEKKSAPVVAAKKATAAAGKPAAKAATKTAPKPATPKTKNVLVEKVAAPKPAVVIPDRRSEDRRSAEPVAIDVTARD